MWFDWCKTPKRHCTHEDRPESNFRATCLHQKFLVCLSCEKNRGMTLFLRGSRSRILVQIRFEFFPMKVVSMPIRVTCQCGQSLNVPDSMAGKSGKCPKCQQLVKIPLAASADAGAPAKAAATAKKAKPQLVSPQPSTSTMAGLLDAAGLVQKSGTFCPHCDQPSKPGAVICTHCGFNFAEGTKVEGHKSSEKRQFGNKNLNEAAAMMVREESVQKRLLATGTPWWTMFASFLGLVIFLAVILVKMDATQTGEVSKTEWMARIQKAFWGPVIAGASGTGFLLVAIFAYLALIFTAFFESKKQGFLCLLAPPYIVYYMFSRIKSQKLFGTVVIIWITSILAGFLLSYALPKI